MPEVRTWTGKIVTLDGQRKMQATVTVIPTSADALGDWYGYGVSEKPWPPGIFETNIGRIVIASVRDTADGEWEYELLGSGPPRGPLA